MSKASRVDRVKNDLDRDDLLRRLPEIEHIYDDDVRESTITTFLDGCPEYFWEKPTSSTGKHHSLDECGKHGNWLHTKRVFAVYCDISESHLEAGELSEYERSCGKSAALLHDMLKYGWPSEQNDHTVSDHDLIGAAVSDKIGGAPATLQDLIATHNGPWYDGPTPSTQHQWVFHSADKVAAKRGNDIGVYSPSKELSNEWPNITVLELDEDEKI
jgi:hypothetical protein